MSYTNPIDGIRSIIRETFCGGEDEQSFGFRFTIEAVRSHLLSYINAVDPESVGPPDLVVRIEEDLRLKECELHVERCRCAIRDELDPHALTPLEKPPESKSRTQLANLLIIPEQLEAACFSISRLTRETAYLIEEVAHYTEDEERKKRGLSEFAQFEIREMCQRLHTITVLTACVIRESPRGFPGQTHISQLSHQLSEFANFRTPDIPRVTAIIT